MAEVYAVRKLAGWGRLFPADCRVFRTESRGALARVLEGNDCPDVIARGLGRSYGDAAQNADGGVVDLTRLDRMIAFDPATGVLECEGGVTIQEIVETFLPRGFFPAVTPGTKFVTVGGAIANDVHGKNHHRDGGFCRHVLGLTLLTPQVEVLRCSPEENAEVFWATAGGIGLTGIILTARLRLLPVETAHMALDFQRAHDLDAVLAAMAESDDRYRYSVAWLDALAGNSNLGRAVLMRGDHATRAQVPTHIADPLATKPSGHWKNFPCDLPSFALNPLSVKAFNALYYAMHGDAQGRIVDYESYFYPLDGIGNWNRLYGKRGFVQYQALLPKSEVAALRKILERLAKSRRGSFLAVLKAYGEANPGPLSYPFPGYTLALDLPMGPGLTAFLHELDTVLLDHGGRLYLAKDALAKPETIAAMYPELDRFREIKSRLDPSNRLSSCMARRLRIVPDRGRHGN